MKITPKRLILFVIVLFGILFGLSYYNVIREDFDATGYFYNGNPEWFNKQKYDMNQWLVNVYPDRIQPACLPYSITNKYGIADTGLLNFYSQSYQFWRM